MANGLVHRKGANRMKQDTFHKICTAVIFTLSIILSWGGIIYATNDPNQFRSIGILVSFVGYGIFFWAILRYEKESDDSI